MSYPDTRYCKHCQKDHPFSERYFFLNGGLLRKCKKFYSAYEAARNKARADGVVWTKAMFEALRKQVRES
jgi:hypothetical protein